MSQSDENIEAQDELVKAALIPQPSDPPKEEKSTEEETTDVGAGEETTNPTPEDEPETPAPESSKPESEEEKPENLDKPTRKERREERKKFLESVRRDQDQRFAHKDDLLKKPDPEFKPLDYSDDEYDLNKLQEDRSKFGENKFAEGTQEGAKTERYFAEQDNFWQSTQYEARLLASDPKFAFLDPKNDTDADKAEDVNELFLEYVGFDADSNTVKRPDISYEKFAREIVEKMEKWAQTETDDTETKLAAQHSTNSIRPSGGSRKSLGSLKPGDISKMSDEDYEKNRAAINRQIMSAFK